MAPSRAALADEIAPDPVRIAAVAAIAGEHQPPAGGTEGLEEWRDSAIDHLTTLTQDAEEAVGPHDGATALQGLTDIRVRDTFLWDMAQPGTDPRAVADRLADLVRCAPAGLVAPAATALAIAQWSGGDGARANVALDRATADDPEYSLAHLVGTALRSGLPPSTWAASLADLDRDTCRHGMPPVAPPAPAAHAPSPAVAPHPHAGTVHRHGELAAPPLVAWGVARPQPPQVLHSFPRTARAARRRGVTVTSMPLTFTSGSGRPPGSTLC